MLFQAFAAVVIGGVSLKGGVGQLSGVYAGVLLLSSIHTAINLMDIPAHYTQIILGALVLAAVLLDTVKTSIRAEARMRGRLDGQVALVIGAARGIGAGIAERFVEEGARVVIADCEEAAGQATAKRLGGARPRTSSRPTFRKEADAERPSPRRSSDFGRLDILVQNAGIYPWTLIENIEADEWDQVLAVNLQGLLPRRTRRTCADEGGAAKAA